MPAEGPEPNSLRRPIQAHRRFCHVAQVTVWEGAAHRGERFRVNRGAVRCGVRHEFGFPFGIGRTRAERDRHKRIRFAARARRAFVCRPGCVASRRNARRQTLPGASDDCQCGTDRKHRRKELPFVLHRVRLPPWAGDLGMGRPVEVYRRAEASTSTEAWCVREMARVSAGDRRG